ncbi:hypothetical protein [Frankia sp. Cj5]|uniref:hypothetical protein n=1 Tax=Frankia sp. Cj5 TaxID=2880978 RepID=UPI001EF59B9A|nr:hypothetical protein [Frankia sp. Cj5]
MGGVLVADADGKLHVRTDTDDTDIEHTPGAADGDTRSVSVRRDRQLVPSVSRFRGLRVPADSAAPDGWAEEFNRLQRNLISLCQRTVRWQRERDEAIELLMRERSEYRDAVRQRRERLRKLTDAAGRHWGDYFSGLSSGDTFATDDVDVDPQATLCYPATWLLPDEPLPEAAEVVDNPAAPDEWAEEISRFQRNLLNLERHADRLRRERNEAKILWAWEKAAHIDAEWCHEEYLTDLLATVHRYRDVWPMQNSRPYDLGDDIVASRCGMPELAGALDAQGLPGLGGDVSGVSPSDDDLDLLF